jgi:prophage antirepressor-like protein
MSLNSIIPFAFEESLVRVRVDENGDPWFVAKDVCRVLELGNPSEAVRHLDDDEKADLRITEVSSNGVEQARNMNIVSESGLYTMIFRSRKPEAKRFRKWVTAEVLPSIRKTGRYVAPRAEAEPALPPSLMPLPQEALALRPSMRERLWSDAMQAARLDNAGTDVATAWFAELCRMMTAGRRSGVWSLMRAFMDDCLEPDKGCNSPAHKIYAAFLRWWPDHSELPPPGRKSLGEALQERFVRLRSNGSFYKDCRMRT